MKELNKRGMYHPEMSAGMPDDKQLQKAVVLGAGYVGDELMEGLPESFRVEKARASQAEPLERGKDHIRFSQGAIANLKEELKDLVEGGILASIRRARKTGSLGQPLGSKQDLKDCIRDISNDLRESQVEAERLKEVILPHQEAFIALPEEEQEEIIDIRMEEARRVKNIAMGIAFAAKLKEDGIDPCEWGKSLSKYLSSLEEGETDREQEEKLALLEAELDRYEAGEIEISPRHLDHAAVIHGYWVRGISWDMRKALQGKEQSGSKMTLLMASLKAMQAEANVLLSGRALYNPEANIAEGVATGGDSRKSGNHSGGLSVL